MAASKIILEKTIGPCGDEMQAVGFRDALADGDDFARFDSPNGGAKESMTYDGADFQRFEPPRLGRQT